MGNDRPLMDFAMAKDTLTPSAVPTLARTLEARVDDLRGFVRRALRSWDPDAIHQARVATRRLKAAIDLLQPLLSDEPRLEFARSLRKLRRTLGPLRDADVMLDHLESLRVPEGLAAGAAWVTRRMREHKADLRREAARKLTPRKALARLESWVDLEQEVRESHAAAPPLLARVAPVQVRDFAARADRVATREKATAAPQAPADDHEGENVHELRVAGKLLRYTLELAEPLGYNVPRSIAKDFKKLQDALGLWHDFAVLTDKMLSLAIETHLAARCPEVYGQVLNLARLCWARSERYLYQFCNLWTAGGAVLGEGVIGIFAGSSRDAVERGGSSGDINEFELSDARALRGKQLLSDVAAPPVDSETSKD